ncbi:type IV pilin protein [Clostridium sp.]|uniref:type IV pilin protein n=1 Tax=Clostridium sp. TaxID=1506 RepID=UPI0026DCF0FF|nr:prepilin-type N-terminal cleavage/methylation domain-containing protein [Clostridium sp.]MDO5038647.1 prepilin-type N-terminal cleavage/methylation domain-containing protein [Clostridium sp.]
MNKLMKKKKKGFTLIELIAVIAILAVLAVIAVPRVISYVEKSKKVAIQTEAATIYNAAEAAYNDGRLKDIIDSTKFNDMDVKTAITELTSNNLLSNVNTNKFKNIQNIKLKDLKTIMNANLNDIKLNGDNLAELPKSSNEVDSSSVTQGQGHK